MSLSEDDKPQNSSRGEDARGQWSKQLDFILSMVGYAVGLGNMWRFPYICMRNGGGAFLIPYFLILFLCGIPLFFLELAIGQYSGVSACLVWKISPMFKGIGIGMVVVSTIVSLYYNIIISWVLFFLAHAFTSELPWASCDNSWNTPACFQPLKGNLSVKDTNVTGYATGFLNSSMLLSDEEPFNTMNASLFVTVRNKTRTPTEEFWEYYVLSRSSGIDNMGYMKWQLVLCLLVAWILIYCCLFAGVKSLGKVVYVTATTPYIFLTVLLIRACLVPGAMNGIKFYIKPEFHMLLNVKVWGEAALQIFYSLGPGWGGIITMASYNKFTNNCVRDAILIPIINCGTSFYAGFVIFSILGFLAEEIGSSVPDVVASGPGLAFIAYPSGLARLPMAPVWAILFLLMLLSIGLGSQFGQVETLISAIDDQFPHLRKKKKWVAAAVCVIMFTIGLPFTTQGGVYLFQIMDWYCGIFSTVVITLFECIVVSYIYGVNRIYKDIEIMIGHKLSICWKIAWRFVTPAILLGILVFTWAGYKAPSYGDYNYPTWAVALGWILASISVVPIPLCMLFQLIQVKGSLRTRLLKSIAPSSDWSSRAEMHHIYETGQCDKTPAQAVPLTENLRA